MENGVMLTLLLFLSPVFAKPHIPEAGSKERKEILNAVRDSVEDMLRQPLVFRVKHLKVEDGWAFLIAEARTKDDKSVDYSKTRFAQDAKWMDEGVIALIRFKRGRWYVVEKSLFQTDVWWAGIWKDYGAPKAIFEMGAQQEKP